MENSWEFKGTFPRSPPQVIKALLRLLKWFFIPSLRPCFLGKKTWTFGVVFLDSRLRKSNVQASDWKVQDLNADPKLPYGDGELPGNLKVLLIFPGIIWWFGSWVFLMQCGGVFFFWDGPICENLQWYRYTDILYIYIVLHRYLIFGEYEDESKVLVGQLKSVFCVLEEPRVSMICDLS